MKKMIAICLATLLGASLGGCIKVETLPENIPTKPSNEQEKEPLKRNGYVGKYSMVGAKINLGDEEYQKVIDGMFKDSPAYKESEKIKEIGGFTFDDLDVKSEILCLEIRENKDVNVCIGGFAAEEAKLVNEDGKTYIKLDNVLLTGYGDKILLGEADVDGKHYLTFETDTDRKTYFEMLENNVESSKIEINNDGSFKIEGIFRIDSEIEEQETGRDVFALWGSGFRSHGSHLRINQDKTGEYSIGVARYEEFKLVTEDGKTYLEIVNKENDEMREEDGARHLVEVREINNKKCIVINKDKENEVNTYWTQLSDDAIVFNIPDKGEYIWG